MSLTINIYYTGKNGSARAFAKEMVESGLVERIRNEEGNLKYEYFFSMDDEETVLLIDRWENEEALDKHHKTEMMKEIAKLRDKYNLHMRVEQFVKKININSLLIFYFLILTRDVLSVNDRYSDTAFEIEDKSILIKEDCNEFIDKLIKV